MRETLRLKKPTKEVNVIREDEGLPMGPRSRQTFKFVYIHYPKSWTFDTDLGFLPRVKKVEACPGLNGCKKNGSLALTLARVTEMGGTVLDPKDQRLGDYQDYVHFYPIRGGGKYYVDFNKEAVVLPNDEVMWNTHEQRDQWNEFMVHVRDCGMIQPLLKEVYLSMLERERKKANSLGGRLDRNPHLANKLERTNARIEGMQAHWNAANKVTDEMMAKAKKPSKRVAKKVTE